MSDKVDPKKSASRPATKDLVLKLNVKVYDKISAVADETAENDLGFPRLAEAQIGAIVMASLSEEEIRRAVSRVFKFAKRKAAGATDEEAAEDDKDEADPKAIKDGEKGKV